MIDAKVQRMQGPLAGDVVGGVQKLSKALVQNAQLSVRNQNWLEKSLQRQMFERDDGHVNAQVK